MPRGRGLAGSSGPRVGCACPLLILDRSGRTGANAACNQAARAVTEWLRRWASDVGSWCESGHWLCLWGAATATELNRITLVLQKLQGDRGIPQFLYSISSLRTARVDFVSETTCLSLYAGTDLTARLCSSEGKSKPKTKSGLVSTTTPPTFAGDATSHDSLSGG